jgi:thiamine biosynthesis lipoprotein
MKVHEFKAMGCRMLAILDLPEEATAAELDQVPAWFEDWEQSLSRFRETSELNRLNASAGTPTWVSESLWDVLQTALEAEHRSFGLVTPAVLDALVTAGYDRSFDQLAALSMAPPEDDFAPVGSLAAVVLDEPTHSVCLPEGLHLDFGGVAKGWAADQAAGRLAACGPALVNAGGDIAVSGPPADGGAWPIGIADPFNPDEDLDTLMLSVGGVATSGRDYRRWQRDGIWQHHIIDPRTGRPAQADVLTATVVAPSAVEAEVAAKVVVISGSQAALEWLDARPTLAGMLVLEDGQRLYSRRIAQYLWS